MCRIHIKFLQPGHCSALLYTSHYREECLINHILLLFSPLPCSKWTFYCFRKMDFFKLLSSILTIEVMHISNLFVCQQYLKTVNPCYSPALFQLTVWNCFLQPVSIVICYCYHMCMALCCLWICDWHDHPNKYSFIFSNTSTQPVCFHF